MERLSRLHLSRTLPSECRERISLSLMETKTIFSIRRFCSSSERFCSLVQMKLFNFEEADVNSLTLSSICKYFFLHLGSLKKHLSTKNVCICFQFLKRHKWNLKKLRCKSLCSLSQTFPPERLQHDIEHLSKWKSGIFTCSLFRYPDHLPQET